MLRERFPRTTEHPEWDLCVSNAQRIALNAQRNLRESAAWMGESIRVPAEQQADGHPAVLFPGVRMIGRATGHGVVNGVLYEVNAVTPEGATLRELGRDASVDVPVDKMKRIALAGALTVFAAQGKTLPGRVRVHSRGSHTSCRTLTVGVSRATHVDLVEVC